MSPPLGPLDRVASIKVKLGLLVAVSVLVAAVLGTGAAAGGVAAWLAIPVTVALALGVTQLLAVGMTSPLRQMTEAVGAKRVGASRKALLGAVLGTVGGLFFVPIGLFVGPFVGALLGELWHLRKVDRDGLGQAAKVGIGTWIGIVLGVALKLALAFAMIALFLLAWHF